MKSNVKPLALVILDGFGYTASLSGNAVYQANMLFFKSALTTYPHTLLDASGPAVGLPPGFMGNSEVGHFTLGAGRVIKQDLTIINQAIDDSSFFSNTILTEHLKALNTTQQTTNSSLHLIGLISDAGVHSYLKHLYALIRAAKNQGIQHVFLHLILDGRDTAPQSAPLYLEKIEEFCKELGVGTLASLHGRYYAMDRNRNWDRTQASVDILTKDTFKAKKPSWQDVIQESYKNKITDEFIQPTALKDMHIIKPHNLVILFNFRPDRIRQLTQLLSAQLLSTTIITLTDYGLNLALPSMFPLLKISNTLKEILSNAGKRIFTIAETEKYAHVTYFFDGARELPFPGETRILIHSKDLARYSDFPTMSAPEITDAVLTSLANDPHDFYLINYANADMVGHSGNFDATVKACEILDDQLKKLYETIVTQSDGTLCIVGDHGKAEEMIDPITKGPKTAHTTNPVYFILIRKDLKGKPLPALMHGLADVAPLCQKLILPMCHPSKS